MPWTVSGEEEVEGGISGERGGGLAGGVERWRGWAAGALKGKDD